MDAATKLRIWRSLGDRLRKDASTTMPTTTTATTATTISQSAVARALRYANDGVRWASEALAREAARPPATPLMNWLDHNFADDDGYVRTEATEANYRWTINLVKPDSDIPRRLVRDGIVRGGLSKRTDSYNGSIVLDGETPSGELVRIYGYLGTCVVETYEATVTRTRAVCGAREDFVTDETNATK
jgi:hypothetical protein